MKVTKFFALAIVVASIAVGMVSCTEKPKGESEVTDPTVDEKNILLDLPSFVKSVEGKTLEEIKAVLTKRGYSYVGTAGVVNVFAINAKNITMDDYTSGDGGVEFMTTKTTFLELALKDNGGIEGATVLYVLPQDYATAKYATVHKNAYATYKNDYPFTIDPAGEIAGVQWNAVAMNLENQYYCTNAFELLQYMYDNEVISESDYESTKEQLISADYKSYAEFLKLIPKMKYILEDVYCIGLDEKVAYYNYLFIDKDMIEALDIKVIPEGMAAAVGFYFEESELYIPLKSPEKTKRVENSMALQKLMNMFNK